MATPAANHSPPPPPPPPPPDAQNPAIITLNNRVSDAQIYTALYLMAIIGLFCFTFFIIFRRGIKLYQTRLYLANVIYKPPKMSFKGHRQLWSWLVPIFTVTEEEIIRSCGLDSLMLVRLPVLGVQLFVPVTILACVVLIPTYSTQNYLNEQHAQGDVATTSTPFSRATMGNVRRGSPLFWVAFVFVYVVVAYASWLLHHHYKAFARLRQQYILRGEVEANDWHETYIMGATRKRSLGKSLKRPSGLQQVAANFATPMPQDGHEGSDSEGERTDDVPAISGASGTSDAADSLALRHRALRRSGSPLLRRLASRRNARSTAVAGSGSQLDSRTGSADSTASSYFPGGSPAPRSHAGSFVGPSGDSYLGDRPLSPLQLPSGVGVTGDYSGSPSRTVSGDVQALPEASSASKANYQEQMFNMHERAAQMEKQNQRTPGSGPHLTRMSSLRHHGSTDTTVPLPASMDDDGTASEAGSYVLPQFYGTSRYETERDKDEEADSGVVVYKWWQGERDPHGNLLSGKPNVWERKVVNTTTETGRTVGVMAQQYVVLVEGVPDPGEQQQSWFKSSRLGRVLSLARQRRRNKRGTRPDSNAPDSTRSTPHNSSIIPIGTNGEHIAIEIGSGPGNEASAAAKHGGSSDKPPTAKQMTKMAAEEALTADPNDFSNAQENATADLQARQMQRDARDAALVAKETAAVGPRPLEGGAKGGWHNLRRRTSEDSDVPMSRQEVVHEFFSYLFPDEFQMALPVLKHKEVDLLLKKWDAAAKQLELAEAAYEASECTVRPKTKIGGFCCCGRTEVDSINHCAKLVRELEIQIGEARQQALRSDPTGSFFVFFNDQKAATIAAQASLQSEDGRNFRVTQAPGPEEVNWPTLWVSLRQRNIRAVLAAIPIVIMILVPIGIFAGSVTQTTLLLCGTPNSVAQTNVKWPWYCSGNNYVRKLITGVVPPLVLTFWQGIVVPRFFYYWCQAERRAQSYTQLDQRILDVFYWWSVFSVFLGAMLGGSIFSQFRVVLEDPSKIASIIGTALPTSSNFFINYMITQAFLIQPFRFMFPHMGVFPWMFRACGFCKPPTKRVEMDRLWPHSARGAKEIAFMILPFIIGLAYAAASPLILPVTLAYFIISWAFWKYAMLYYFERCYESGGRLFERIFSQLVFTLFIFEAFTAAVLFASSAWVQGSVMLITLTVYLYQFHKYCVLRFNTTKYVPLESAAAAPKATVDPAMYVPPALRHGCAGWVPEAGAAWEGWGAKVYTI